VAILSMKIIKFHDQKLASIKSLTDETLIYFYNGQ
jgi:hypothetical protein